MRISAVGPVRIDHGGAVGQALLALVVIGDDELHAELSAHVGLVQCGNAAVHRDDQPHALGRELFDGGRIQAVALLQPAGNVIKAVRAQRAQAFDQKTGGRDAIHVVIAENGDLCTACNGGLEKLRGLAQLLHGQRVAQRRIDVQKRPRRFRRFIAAPAEHACGQGRIARPLERLNLCLLRLRNVPDSVLHTKYTS